MNKLNQTVFGWDTELFTSILQEGKQPHLRPPETHRWEWNQSIPTSPTFFVKGMEKMSNGCTNFIQFLTLTRVSLHSSCCFDLKNTYVWWVFFPYPFLCIPSLLPVLKLYMKAPTKPIGFLFEYSQLTWSYLLLGIGWKIFFHTPECIIQINCRKTPMYLPCKLHLKGSLVSLGTLIHVAAEKKIVPACIPHFMCGNGSSSREQTTASLPFLERHWKAKWDWWGFTLKYQVVKHRCSAAPPQAV